MALDTSGTASPAALIADPFAHCFAYASQMGVVASPAGAFNPIDAFPASSAPGGLAVIVLNSLPTPLRLVESYVYVDAGAVYLVNGAQVSYPVDPWNGAHVIPAARPYPKNAKHSGAWMAGLGVYCFTASSYPRVGQFFNITTVTEVARALSFSAADDGSGPLAAVAFRTKDATLPNGVETIQPYAAVTADLQGGLDAFYARTMGRSGDEDDDDQSEPGVMQYDVGKGNDGLTIWATSCTTPSKTTAVDYSVTVWVRNISSTVG